MKAGLGVTVLPKDMVPAGLAAVERREDLPNLRDTEIALLSVRKLSAPARRLREYIVRSLEDVGGAGRQDLDETSAHPISTLDSGTGPSGDHRVAMSYRIGHVPVLFVCVGPGTCLRHR